MRLQESTLFNNGGNGMKKLVTLLLSLALVLSLAACGGEATPDASDDAPASCLLYTSSDRGTQYTSESYRQTIREHHIHQSMNSAGGRCHDNARCESMWARMKTELLYDRYDTRQMTVEELKALIWRYFLSYWNNRRICSANGGLPPMIKRRQYYEDLELVA